MKYLFFILIFFFVNLSTANNFNNDSSNSILDTMIIIDSLEHNEDSLIYGARNNNKDVFDLSIIIPIILAFFGIITSIITIWVKSYTQKKKDAQDWYFDYYIINGLDKIIIYLSFLELKYISLNRGLNLNLGNIPSLPIDALFKLEIITHKNTFTGAIPVLTMGLDNSNINNTFKGDTYPIENLLNEITYMKDKLFELRTILVDINQKVSRKSNVLKLFDNIDIQYLVQSISFKYLVFPVSD